MKIVLGLKVHEVESSFVELLPLRLYFFLGHIFVYDYVLVTRVRLRSVVLFLTNR